jgi:hypothetical protein
MKFWGLELVGSCCKLGGIDCKLGRIDCKFVGFSELHSNLWAFLKKLIDFLMMSGNFSKEFQSPNIFNSLTHKESQQKLLPTSPKTCRTFQQLADTQSSPQSPTAPNTAKAFHFVCVFVDERNNKEHKTNNEILHDEK